MNTCKFLLNHPICGLGVGCDFLRHNFATFSHLARVCACPCHGAHWMPEDNPRKSVLPFHRLGLRSQTQVTGAITQGTSPASSCDFYSLSSWEFTFLRQIATWTRLPASAFFPFANVFLRSKSNVFPVLPNPPFYPSGLIVFGSHTKSP